MNHFTPEYFPILFIVFFVGMWLVMGLIFGLLTHWYALMRNFPDRPEPALLMLRGQTGKMGVAQMRGILTVSVCESGLRVGVLRIFGPLCKNFFVPWNQIQVERKGTLLGKSANIEFGEPRIGSLRLSSDLADRLARSSQGKWPEDSSFTPETRSEAKKAVFREWLIGTSLAALFFSAGPRLLVPNAAGFPPLAVTILFPAIVFGIASVVRYHHRIKNST